MKDFITRLQSLTAEPSKDTGDDAIRRGRVSRTRDEMMDQGARLNDTLSSEAEGCRGIARAVAERGVTRIVIAGCGDSWFAAIGARLAMERATGLVVEPVQAFDWAHFAGDTADAQTLVVGISSGGSTPAVLAALDSGNRRGAMAIGVSNTAGSKILTDYDGGLVVHATRKGWPTQSSTATIGLLIALGIEIGVAMGRDVARLESQRDELLSVGTAMDRVAQAFDADAQVWAERVVGASLVLFAGAGPHFAAAAFGAAKVRELSPIHSMAMPLEEYHHYRSQKWNDPLFLVAPDTASRERALDTALVSDDIGGRTVALLPGPDSEIDARVSASWRMPKMSDALAPLVYSVPIHLFAYHFAEARFARNLGYPGHWQEK